MKAFALSTLFLSYATCGFLLGSFFTAVAIRTGSLGVMLLAIGTLLYGAICLAIGVSIGQEVVALLEQAENPDRTETES